MAHTHAVPVSGVGSSFMLQIGQCPSMGPPRTPGTCYFLYLLIGLRPPWQTCHRPDLHFPLSLTTKRHLKSMLWIPPCLPHSRDRLVVRISKPKSLDMPICVSPQPLFLASHCHRHLLLPFPQKLSSSSLHRALIEGHSSRKSEHCAPWSNN